MRENTKNILGSEVQEHQRGQTSFDDLCLGIGLNIVVRSQGIHIYSIYSPIHKMPVQYPFTVFIGVYRKNSLELK